jgi:hypothetical protein
VETVQWKRQQNQEFKGLAETFLLFVKVNFERLESLIGYKAEKSIWG